MNPTGKMSETGHLIVYEGKTITLEYERNFNNFVKWAKPQLTC